MTTKTVHRIPADKVVVEDDRRTSLRNYVIPDASLKSIGRRKSPHDYSQKHKIIYVPVEPQPTQDSFLKTWECNGLLFSASRPHYRQGDTEQNLKKLLMEVCPCHPDDTLILTEEWMDVVLNPEGDGKTKGLRRLSELTFSQGTISMAREGGDLKSASTMPPELDSQCQQYNVVKVLGVEEKMMSPNPLADGMWHWILLVRQD